MGRGLPSVAIREKHVNVQVDCSWELFFNLQ